MSNQNAPDDPLDNMLDDDQPQRKVNPKTPTKVNRSSGGSINADIDKIVEKRERKSETTGKVADARTIKSYRPKPSDTTASKDKQPEAKSPIAPRGKASDADRNARHRSDDPVDWYDDRQHDGFNRFVDNEKVRVEVIEEHSELLPTVPAQTGFFGALNKMGLSIKPSHAEMKEREDSLDALVSEKVAERESEMVYRLVNRPTRRTKEYCGYFSVVSEKGGVGKTTLSVLLSYFLSEWRKAPIGIVDLNPDKGNLNDKFGIVPQHTISDLVENQRKERAKRTGVKNFLTKVPGYNINVLAGETDPLSRAKTTSKDVEDVYRALYKYMSMTIFDNGTGITHSAMNGALSASHGMVIVIDNTNDAVNYVQSMLQYVEQIGCHDLRKRVIVAVNSKVLDYNTMLGMETVDNNFVTAESLKDKFKDLVRHVEIIPFDPVLANSGQIDFTKLQPETIRSVGRITAVLIDDLVR